MKSPYTVTVDAKYFVGNNIPRPMAIALQNASLKSIGRLLGGMDNPALEIFPFFDVALAGINGGVLWSGGSRMIKPDGAISASVAEVVARLGATHKQLITMGSNPRVETFTFQGEGILTLEQSTGAFVNPDTQYVVTVQGDNDDDKAGSLDWDGDVHAYHQFMAQARDLMGFRPYSIVWNGGGVTVKEAILSQQFGFPVFVISGSGRQADDKLSTANFQAPNIYHVHKSEPEELRDLLKNLGLSR